MRDFMSWLFNRKPTVRAIVPQEVEPAQPDAELKAIGDAGRIVLQHNMRKAEIAVADMHQEFAAQAADELRGKYR